MYIYFLFCNIQYYLQIISDNLVVSFLYDYAKTSRWILMKLVVMFVRE